MSFFITATDTGAGKTYVTCLLLRALRAAGRKACGFKPVSCGDRADAAALQVAGDGKLSPDEINPVWFRHALSPLAAARLENRSDKLELEINAMRRAWIDLSGKYTDVLVEGAGGWEVPLAPGMSMADLAVEWTLPVIVVANNKLGALNHTVLTVGAIRSRGLTCAGLVLNHPDAARDSAADSNAAILREILPDVPLMAVVEHDQTRIDAAPFMARGLGQK